MRTKYYTLFLVITAAILGGGAGVFAKISLLEIPPFSFTFLRFLVAAIFLIPFSIKHLPSFRKEDYKVILLSLLASLNVILFAFGIKYTTANMGQVIYTAVPIVSALLSFKLLKERFGFIKIVGIVIGFIGTITVILLPLISNSNDGGSIVGNLLIFVAMLSISVYWVLSKRFQEKYTPTEINNYFIFTTTFLLLFLSVIDLIRQPSWWQEVSLNAYLSLGFVAVFSTAIYYLISQIVIKKATPVMASMVLYVQPFATFIWAYYFLAEKLSSAFLVAIFLSLLGVGIYNYSIFKQFSDQNL